MAFPFRSALIGFFVLFFALSGNGCLSYRVLREMKGSPVPARPESLRPGLTSMGEALAVCGAPNRVMELSGRDLWVYERSIFFQNSIAFGIPISDFAGSSVSVSGYTNLTRFDTLALVFRQDGILEDVVFEQGSSLPYLETLFGSRLK